MEAHGVKGQNHNHAEICNKNYTNNYDITTNY